MANRYWVGGTGTWDAANTINWSDVSNGAGGFSLPTAADDVFFDNFSNGTITIPTSNTGLAKSITCTNFNGIIQGAGNMTVSGNVTLSTTTTFNFNVLTINSNSTITSVGRSFSCDVYINASGATVQLADNFSALNNGLLLLAGTFKTNNYNVTFDYFDSNNGATRVLDLGTSQITSRNTTGTCWQILQSNMTVNGSQATFNFTSSFGSGASPIRLGTGGTAESRVYGTINLTGSGDYSIGGIAIIKTIKSTTTSILPYYVSWNSDGSPIIENFLLTGKFLASGSGDKILSLYNNRAVYSGNNRIILNNIYASNTGFSYTIDENNPYRVYAYNSDGANTAGIAFMDGTKKTAYLLTANTTWTVPPDWNNNDNKIYLIGAGGGGCPGVGSGSNRAGGAGGGGGGFTVINNFNTTPGNTITYSIGVSAANTDGGDTTWDSGAFVAGGGKRGNSSVLPNSTGGAGGSGTFTGGAGGAGAVTTVASTGCGGGGGGGAAGIYGNGGQGGIGFANTTSANISGGGGGGNGGGTNGSNGTSGLGGDGGKAFEDPNTNGVGSSGNGSRGRDGGGGAGAAGTTGVPGFGGTGNDIESNTIGGGGGQGGLGSGNANLTRNIALYGGGGGGGSINAAGTTYTGGAGSNGAILIVYTSTPISPYGGRLYNDGTFMSGDSEFDEVNSNNKFSISKLDNKIYANTFDEVTINSDIARNLFSATSSTNGPTWGALINVNATTGSIVDPIGQTRAVPYISSNNASSVIHSPQAIIGAGTSNRATASVFAKADTVRYFNITVDNGSSNGFFATFDALQGVIIGTGENGGVFVDATSKYYGNGWWRFSVSGYGPDILDRFSINILGTATNAWFPSTTIPLSNGLYFTFFQFEPHLTLTPLILGSVVPFANVPMRLETTNELFVENELDEINLLP